MKKICLVLITLLLVLTGCGKNEEKEVVVEPKEETKETTNTLVDVPAGFAKGLIEPEFEKFNLPASENGLGGTMIVKYGRIKTVVEVEANGGQFFAGVFEDNEGNPWYALYGFGNAGDKIETYEEIIEHDVCVKAQYTGYSGVYEMPAFTADSIFDRTNGNIIGNSGYDLMYKDKEVWASENETEKETKTEVEEVIEEIEETKEENSNVIRPEIKEAIDAYETFVDEYCEFMKKNSQNSSSMSMLLEYANYMSKLAEAEEKMDALTNNDLNAVEDAYYADVLLRCSQKMLKAASEISK